MGDIDFEELDKAVNSLMGKNTVSTDNDDQPKQKTLSINSTLKPGDSPAFDKLESVAKKIGSDALVAEGEVTKIEELDAPSAMPATTPVAPLEPVVSEAAAAPISAAAPAAPVSTVPAPTVTAAPKRPSSGRFMDVVHPSSDMKTAGSTPSLSVPERTQPVMPRPVAPAPAPAQRIDTPPTPAPFVTPPAPTVLPETQPDPKPLTPFLPDAKVEKRPLGGGQASVTGAFDVAGENQAPTLDANPAEAKALEIAEIESLDNDNDKTARESDEQRPLDPKDFSDQPSAIDQQLSTIESSEIGETTPMPEVSESVRAVESGDTEKILTESKAAQENSEAVSDNTGGIFDVQNHPQSLGHPAKQKSGWGRVLIIVLIVILCAAAAGAAYYLLGMNQ